MPEFQAMRLASANSPAAAAWAAYDAAMLSLQRLYSLSAPGDDAPAMKAARARKAEETVKLWAAWRQLFLADTGKQ